MSYIKYLLSSAEVHGISSYSSVVNTGTELNPASLSRSEDFQLKATSDNSLLKAEICSEISSDEAIHLNTHLQVS